MKFLCCWFPDAEWIWFWRFKIIRRTWSAWSPPVSILAISDVMSSSLSLTHSLSPAILSIPKYMCWVPNSLNNQSTWAWVPLYSPKKRQSLCLQYSRACAKYCFVWTFLYHRTISWFGYSGHLEESTGTRSFSWTQSLPVLLVIISVELFVVMTSDPVQI